MPRVTDAELLDVWERGQGAGPAERGLLLLTVADPAGDPAELAALPLGRRDGLLLDLREQVFGPRIEAVLDCPECTARLEIECSVADLRCPLPIDPPPVRVGELVLGMRLPDTLDLIHAASVGSVGAARRMLFEQCVLPPEGVAAGDLPDEAVAAVAAALRAADPQSAVTLETTCPECGTDADVPYDVVQFFWRELHAWAARTFHEIHTLATAYGWTEATILALAPRRRRVYLDLLTG